MGGWNRSDRQRARKVCVSDVPVECGAVCEGEWSLTTRGPHAEHAHFGKDLADLGRCLGWFRSSWRPASMNRRNS